MFYDTHSHCYWDTILPRIDSVIDDMRARGVTRAVQIGCDAITSRQAIDLALRYPETFSTTVGIHPETAQDMSRDQIDEMIRELEYLLLTHRDQIVAIGECGLDYHFLDPLRSDQQKESQSYSLLLQARLAQQYDLPLVIHTRDARVDTIRLIREYDIRRAVMHCYSEDLSMAEDLMDFSDEIFFSFSGILTYRKSDELRHVARSLPLERILIETDSPFLAPQVVRGSVNTPANVPAMYEQLCEIRGESREEIELRLWENSMRLYGK